MSSPKPIAGYASHTAAVTDLQKQGQTPKQIAAYLGVPREQVYSLMTVAKRGQARISVSNDSISPKARAYLGTHAAKRGITGRELARQLLEIIGEDNMVDAVLDDAGGVE